MKRVTPREKRRNTPAHGHAKARAANPPATTPGTVFRAGVAAYLHATSPVRNAPTTSEFTKILLALRQLVALGKAVAERTEDRYAKALFVAASTMETCLLTSKDEVAFYLMLARLWEMQAGSWLLEYRDEALRALASKEAS